jgi:hypothetical protein
VFPLERTLSLLFPVLDASAIATQSLVDYWRLLTGTVTNTSRLRSLSQRRMFRVFAMGGPP